MTEQRAEYKAEPEGDLVQFNAPDFGVIPSELMCDQELSRSARLLGCLLWTYRNKDTGAAWPQQKTLAERMGVSVRSVKNYMVELREHGWMVSKHRISVDPTYKGNPGALIHTLYWSPNRTLVPQNKGKGEATFPSEGKQASPTRGSSTSQEHTKELTSGTEGGGTPQFSKNSQIAKTISKAEKALLDAAIYPRTITRLIRDFPEGVILEKAEYWREGKLVRAIEEDWQPKDKDPARRYNQGQFADFWDA